MFKFYIFEGTYLLRAASSQDTLFSGPAMTLKRPEPGPRMSWHMYDRRV